eukprot:CAMPEP_0170454422 /NCGR_PEP_ID=MMETSP0123-20130129/2676_1 /TAXON_ID=182087 /ORGANISM="Favella ehrenbergii, Strain Fehren 1" /LENGTH=144 /DNA_ID=CAMNT_0010717123 /DNA_START=32 /DNA_END=466 /DNA_ORIENTATION=-
MKVLGVENYEEVKRVLVFHLEPSYCNVTILDNFDCEFKVRACKHDENLSGRAIDLLLVDYIYEWLGSSPNALKCSLSPTFVKKKLASECSEAWKRLVWSDSAQLRFKDGIPSYKLTRVKFEELVGPILQKCMELVDRTMASACT